MEDRIRERAYFLWLDASKAGDATYFWLIAEREVLAQVAMEAAAKPTPEPAERQSTRRVNALVQLDAGANREQAALDVIAG
ncbi:MAG: DUF2934 domain-containing protein [Rhodoplanes sp.]